MLNLDIMKSRYHHAVDLLQGGNIDEAYQSAAELGSELLHEGGKIEELVDVHTSILRRAAEKIDPLTAGKMLIDTSSLLVKAVLGYSMAYCMADVVGSIRAELQAKRSELEDLYSRLREEDELRSLFATPISHELRNPLNSIIGFTNILLNEWAGPLNQEQKDGLALILAAGKNLLQLVNDLIDVCRIESGVSRSKPEPVHLATAFSEGVERGSGGERARVTVSADPGIPPVHTDRDRVVQLMERLVADLLVVADGPLAIWITSGEVGATATIRFQAPRLPREELERFFNPFFRVEGMPPGQGAGLSLYLMKIIARDLLKGDLTVAAAEENHFTITIRIPELAGQG